MLKLRPLRAGAGHEKAPAKGEKRVKGNCPKPVVYLKVFEIFDDFGKKGGDAESVGSVSWPSLGRGGPP